MDAHEELRFRLISADSPSSRVKVIRISREMSWGDILSILRRQLSLIEVNTIDLFDKDGDLMFSNLIETSQLFKYAGKVVYQDNGHFGVSGECIVPELPRSPSSLHPRKKRARPVAGTSQSNLVVESESNVRPVDYVEQLDTVALTNKVVKKKSRCPHGRSKYYCKECGGGGYCHHGRVKKICRDCGGTGRCEHDRIRSRCKDCGGGSICEHKREKTRCRDCYNGRPGGIFCEHSRRKDKCKDCDGSSICEHGRQKYTCVDCGGKGVCEHSRQRFQCKDCRGSGICVHGQYRWTCKECNGGCDTSRSDMTDNGKTA